MRPILLLGLTACIPEAGVSSFDPDHDWDQDGYTEPEDCDDEDPLRAPGAMEACNAAEDMNCDGETGPCAVTGEMSLQDGFGPFSGFRDDDSWPVAAAGAVGTDGTPWAVTGSLNGYEARLWHFEVTGDEVGITHEIYLGTAGGSTTTSRAAAAGDVDGDGVGDLLISAFQPWMTETGEGTVFLAFGPFTAEDHHLPGEPDVACDWQAPTANSAGEALASTGDFDGDGYPELLIGAPGHRDGNGAVWWIAGGPSLRDCPNLLAMEPLTSGLWEADPASDAGVGSALSGIGDVDGDGVEDMAIGSFGRAEPYGMEVFVVLGADGGLNGTRPLSDIAHANYGTIRDGTYYAMPTSLTRLGDLDGDGRDDLAVGTPGDSNYSGSAWIVLGAPEGAEMALSDTAQIEINGAIHFGATISAGDLDADGIPDLIVGSPREEDGPVGDAGAAWLFAGSTLRETGEYYADQHAYAVVRGTDANGLAGLSLAVIGDVDSDGDDDFVVGERSGLDGAGWLFLGGP